MTKQDNPNLEQTRNPSQDETSLQGRISSLDSTATPLLPGFEMTLQIDRVVRRLIVDYVLAAAILGLLPVYINEKADTFGFLALLLLNAKMISDVRAHWGKPKHAGFRSALGNALNLLEAFLVAVVARLLISTIGLFVPIIVVFNAGIGHAVFTWIIGRSAHQYYFSSVSRDQASHLALSRVRHLRKRNR